MSFLEIFLIAIGLSMDAFAVSICKGLSFKKINFKKCIIVGLYFGTFQALMPLIGYFLAYNLKDFIMIIDHWIAFVLLGLIGFNMIIESKNDESEVITNKIDVKTMLVLAIATSIDALAVGITFAFLNVKIFASSLLIGLMTFAISIIGVKIGNVFGNKYEKKSQIFGGIILILMGFKILIEHLT